MPEALPRIAAAREALPEAVFVQVDGGIDRRNAPAVAEAGASLLVAGMSIFGQPDISAAYPDLCGAVAPTLSER